LIAEQAGHVFAVEQDAIFLLARFQAEGGFGGKAFQARTLVQGECRAKRLQGEGAVHGAGLQIEKAKMPGQMAGYCALSRASRTINGDDDLPAMLKGAQGAFFRTHARFFVSCLGRGLGRAVKPNCLLFPAFVPAAKAGLRLPRTGRASGRESLREAVPLRGTLLLRAVVLGLAAALAPLVWPLR
jgi:hypothetical protein